MKIVLAIVGVCAGLVILSVSQSTPGQANPQFAQQTGKGCSFCHTKPPALNATGKKFKANGYKL